MKQHEFRLFATLNTCSPEIKAVFLNGMNEMSVLITGMGQSNKRSKSENMTYLSRSILSLFFVFVSVTVVSGQTGEKPVRIGDRYGSFSEFISANSCENINQHEFRSKRLSEFFGTPSDTFFWQGGVSVPEHVGCDIIWPCSSEQFYTVREKYGYFVMISLRTEQHGELTTVLTDTLLMPPGYDFSAGGQANVGGKIVPVICVGSMYERDDYFEIVSIYSVSPNGICERLPLNTDVTDCPVPVNYIDETEEIDESGESTYRFGVKGGPRKKRYSL